MIPGKIAAIASCTAGNQHCVGDDGVGANEEIGQHPGPAATGGAISLKRVGGEEQQWTRYHGVDKARASDHRIELLHSPIADRQLGIDDVVDCQLVLG